jgi:hypothetical protein
MKTIMIKETKEAEHFKYCTEEIGIDLNQIIVDSNKMLTSRQAKRTL